MNIFDRLKGKITELQNIINSKNSFKIIVKKEYINGIFKTIHNLDKYKKDAKVKMADFLLRLVSDNRDSFFWTEQYNINDEIINSEQTVNKYSAPSGRFSECEKIIKEIDIVNHAALIKYKIQITKSGTTALKEDTWISLEYLDVI